jgi:hypothetical protein
MTTLAQQIIKSITDNPQMWHRSEYTLNHTNGWQIWTSNSFLFLSLYAPERRTFSLFEKIELAAAISVWNKSSIPEPKSNETA